MSRRQHGAIVDDDELYLYSSTWSLETRDEGGAPRVNVIQPRQVERFIFSRESWGHYERDLVSSLRDGEEEGTREGGDVQGETRRPDGFIQ